MAGEELEIMRQQRLHFTPLFLNLGNKAGISRFPEIWEIRIESVADASPIAFMRLTIGMSFKWQHEKSQIMMRGGIILVL